MSKTKGVLEIITLEQLRKLRESGLVVIHRVPNASMLKAMSSACERFHDCNLEKAYHRAVAASIRQQNEQSYD